MMAMEEEVAAYRSSSIDKALRVAQRTRMLCLDCYFEGDFQPLTFHLWESNPLAIQSIREKLFQSGIQNQKITQSIF